MFIFVQTWHLEFLVFRIFMDKKIKSSLRSVIVALTIIISLHWFETN